MTDRTADLNAFAAIVQRLRSSGSKTSGVARLMAEKCGADPQVMFDAIDLLDRSPLAAAQIAKINKAARLFAEVAL